MVFLGTTRARVDWGTGCFAAAEALRIDSIEWCPASSA
jgi:hypothetical protein